MLQPFVEHAVSDPRASLMRRLAIGALFVPLYWLTDLAAHAVSKLPFDAAPWNPRPALVIALIAIGGPWLIPSALVAVFGARLVVRGEAITPEWLATFATLVVVQCLAGLAVRRFTRWNTREVGVRDLSLLAAIALGAAVIVAVDRTLHHVVSNGLALDQAARTFMRIALGNVIGVIVLAPLILQSAAGAWRPAWQRYGARVLARDAVLFVAVLAVLLAVAFRLKPFDDFQLSYLVIVPLIVVSVRYGLVGAAAAMPVTQAGLLASVALLGTGTASVFEFQFLLLMLASAALAMGVLSSERELAAARLLEQERRLRDKGLKLAEAQRSAAAAELAASLAHDLNQPLSAIGTYARACRMLAEAGPDERAVLFDTLDRLVHETTRAGQYVRRMRDFFLDGTMRAERVDIAAAIEGAHDHLRDRLDRQGILWESEIERELPAVCADSVQVAAILDNLLGNACDALRWTDGRRLIRVRAARAEAGSGPVRISVQDSGPGVPPELRDRLFQPFETNKSTGMGLGLALSRTLAERHGGRLWHELTSVATTFSLELPAYE